MNWIEVFKAMCVGVACGVAYHYYTKCKRLQEDNEAQAETIKNLLEFVQETSQEQIDRMKIWEE